MRRFAAIAAATLALAAPASALTFSLPDLAFPTTATVISTQGCTPSAAGQVALCK